VRQRTTRHTPLAEALAGHRTAVGRGRRSGHGIVRHPRAL